MSHEDRTLGFYNLLAQVEANQGYSDHLAATINLHATSVDQAETYVQKQRIEIDERRQQSWSELTLDINNLYARITAERYEAISQMQAGTIADAKALYAEISSERAKHVNDMSAINLQHLDESVRMLRGLVA